MKKSAFGGTSRFGRFINGRGFYLVMAVCLLTVGGVGVALSMDGVFDEGSDTQPPVSDVQQVEQNITGQPDNRTTTTATTTSTTVATTTTTKAADLYVLPFGNLVQKAYSDGQPVYSDTMQDWRVHDGVDFAGEDGQVVKALADGKVVSVTDDPLWGTVVCLDHGMEVVSRYCGVKATVKAGQQVSVGQSIGTLDSIPCESAQGPHLHLEMTVDGRLADPVTALGREVRYAEDEEE